jgi:hypothetical protein
LYGGLTVVAAAALDTADDIAEVEDADVTEDAAAAELADALDTAE